MSKFVRLNLASAVCLFLTVAFIPTGTECESSMCRRRALPACQQLLKLIRIAARREAGIAGANHRQGFTLGQMR